MDIRKLFAVLVLALATPISAQKTDIPTVRLNIAPSSQLQLEGTSTLHGWKCTALQMSGSVAIAAEAFSETGQAIPASVVKSAEFIVPARALDSGKGKMNKKMFDVLKFIN